MAVEGVDDDFCYLTTLGRITGESHEVEIWFAIDGARLYMLAGAGRRSDWVRNLEAEPSVTICVRDITHTAQARIVTDSVEDRLARTLLFEKYEPRNPGLASWRESALPVAFDLE